MIRVVVNLIIVFWCVCYMSGDISASAPPPPPSPTCRNACNPTKGDKINIHLVPHSHDDVGWLKTPDQYFYGNDDYVFSGSNKIYSSAGVQYILDSVISELDKNPDRRFVYAESAFLWRWWDELTDSDKALVRKLVDQGRLEFALGGWCMSDEATPHYSALIDQMTMGLQFLNETFGYCGRPPASWQIDSFGHSSEVAIQFAEMGFNGVFLGRIDHDDWITRRDSKTLEHIWRPEPSLGEAGDLFVSVMYNLYLAPNGFCFDSTTCGDEPIMENKKLHGYNLDERLKKFEEHMNSYKVAYKTNHVLISMGGDFAYTSATNWFRNMDKLVKYMNARNGPLHLLYSTPACYLNAIHDENVDWPVKESDDYFPYASDEHSYWTGYYTSRPSFKYFTYFANNILQATKQIATILGTKYDESEFEFRRAVAMVQHHDAVSGTQKQHVANDYSVYLQDGINVGQQIFSEAYKKLYGKDYPDQVFGNLRNISQFKLTEDHDNFLITVYNPLSRNKTTPVKFPFVKDYHYEVFNRFGRKLLTDAVPLPPNLSRVPGRHSNATHDLIFMAEDLPALGFASYYVRALQAAPAGYDTQLEERVIHDSIVVLKNGKVQVNFNKTSGLILSVTKNDVTVPFTQNFYMYKPMRGYNYDATSRASGAYIFRPLEPATAEFPNASISEFRGENVFEIHQRFSNWLSQVVRLYKNSDDIEFEWLVGPLPQRDVTGMEIVTRFSTNIANNSTFYTDSNGRRWMKRTRNYRKYWQLDNQEQESGNYYPVTTAISIKDHARQMTVLTDRPQGGSSLQDGEIELMLHRRLVYDDGKGLNEVLDEVAFGERLVVRGRHIVQLNDVSVAVDAHRFTAVESAFHAIPMFAKTSLDVKSWLSQFNTSSSLLTAPLPPNIHVLTLQRVRPNELLLRLEHIFEPKERSTYVKPETVELKRLLSNFTVVGVHELALGGNVEKEKIKRIKWKPESKITKDYGADPAPDKILLHPMQIRTFLLNVVAT